MFVPFQSLALVVIALLAAGVTLIYYRRAEAEAAKLSVADRKRFYSQFSSSADRANMPRHLGPLAQATDRARGARSGVIIIVTIAILFYFL